MCIDIIADEVRKKGIRISSSNVGSLAGIIALKKGISHMAGAHLLDPNTGEYNKSYVERYLKGIKVHVYNLVLREQGLIVKKGNPKKIKGIEDLVREDIRFVNRQPGSGTRVLLDYKLSQLNIDPKQIRGYEHEEFTHMAVAVDILSGVADCGIGIFAAAKALGLDFIPIEKEEYDLIVPAEFLDDPKIKTILEVIKTPQFKKRVEQMGGYDTSRSGELVFTLQ
jgi:putative molybdopterin biosynthesis protein